MAYRKFETVEEMNDYLNENRPVWMDAVDVDDVIAISQGGCASGAYMPAVTYHIANQVMAKYGDDVLEFIEDHLGELPAVPKGESWSGIAVFYLSSAVELWAHQYVDECQTLLDNQ